MHVAYSSFTLISVYLHLFQCDADQPVEKYEDFEDDDEEDDDDVDDDWVSDDGDESDIEDNVELAFPYRRRESNPILPDTVTTLEAAEGCKVYVVGTAHFSIESQEDVSKVRPFSFQCSLP